MAQLIKLKIRPQKYYYWHREQMWPVNQIISRHSHEIKANIENSFHDFENRVRNTLSDFLTKWENEIASANARGSIHRRQRILSDIITLALLWQRNIPSEVEALLTLATKIASTILNTQIESIANQKLQDDLTNKLNSFFNINILIPEDTYKLLEIQPKLTVLLLNNDKQVQNACLKISLDGRIEKIELVGIDIKRMISMALKNISHA